MLPADQWTYLGPKEAATVILEAVSDVYGSVLQPSAVRLIILTRDILNLLETIFCHKEISSNASQCV